MELKTNKQIMKPENNPVITTSNTSNVNIYNFYFSLNFAPAFFRNAVGMLGRKSVYYVEGLQKSMYILF